MDSPGGSYGQITDPLGNYRKPDVNIAIPGGVPITAWDSGVITDVSDKGRNSGGLSVTMSLDHPINSSARYTSFNYLGNAVVSVGQRVQPGTVIGYAGSPYGISFALALGNAPSWGSGGFPQGSGNPAYDPHQILNLLRGGNFTVGSLPSVSPLSAVSFSLGSQFFGNPFISISNSTHDILNNVPGFIGIVNALDNVEQFVPFHLVSTGGQDVGILGHLPFIGQNIQNAANAVTLPSDAIQALLVFITANTMAAIIRLIIIFSGVIILVALIMNIQSQMVESVTGQTPQQLAGTGLKLLASAA